MSLHEHTAIADNMLTSREFEQAECSRSLQVEGRIFDNQAEDNRYKISPVARLILLERNARRLRVDVLRKSRVISISDSNHTSHVKFKNANTVNDTFSLNLPRLYVAHRKVYPFNNLKARSKPSDTFASLHCFRTLSAGSMNEVSCMADLRRNALCPTEGATSPKDG
jgi:hypothetical protein